MFDGNWSSNDNFVSMTQKIKTAYHDSHSWHKQTSAKQICHAQLGHQQ